MSKKKKQTGINLILTILGLAAAGLTFVGLAFNLVTFHLDVGKTTTATNYNLGQWWSEVNKWQDSDKIAGWNVARVFLIITLVLVAIIAALLIVKIFKQHKALNLATLTVSALCIVSAVVFLVTLFVGGNAFYAHSDLLKTTESFLPDFGAYAVTFLSLVTAGLGIAVSHKIK